VVEAAAGKPVLEFGARRTHSAAAIDASYALGSRLLRRPRSSGDAPVVACISGN